MFPRTPRYNRRSNNAAMRAVVVVLPLDPVTAMTLAVGACVPLAPLMSSPPAALTRSTSGFRDARAFDDRVTGRLRRLSVPRRPLASTHASGIQLGGTLSRYRTRVATKAANPGAPQQGSTCAAFACSEDGTWGGTWVYRTFRVTMVTTLTECRRSRTVR